MNTLLRARTFEYAVLSGQNSLANDLLKTLSADWMESLSPIDVRYLDKYFELCLKRDNLDGVAYLTSYCDRYSVDTSRWNLGQFRGALDYYINDRFDLNKVMIFTKFY